MPTDADQPDKPARELSDVLAGLRRRAWVFAASVFAVAGLALLISISHARTYTASAVLLFDHSGELEQRLFGPSTGTQETAAQQTATDHDLASLEIVDQLTARQLGHGLTQQAVARRVTIPTGDQSDIVTVDATGPSPASAAELANAFAAATISYQRQLSQKQILAARGSIDRQIGEVSREPDTALRGTQLATLDADLLNIRLMASVDNGGIELGQPALRPDSASSPRPAHDALIGAFAGLLLGLVLALVLDQRDDRLRGPGRALAALGLPLLAVVPGQRRPGRRRTSASNSRELKEPMRRLHSRLRHGPRGDPAIRSVLITSPAPGSGKTTVAWHLASAAAEAGERVLLIEADLRTPALAEMLGDPGAVGLTELLRTPGADVGEFVHHVRLPPAWLDDSSASAAGDRREGLERPLLLNLSQTRLREQPLAASDGLSRRGFGLDVVFGGFANGEAYALLASPTMSRRLRELEASYDRVIVDSPSATEFSDSLPLMNQVDGVIVVLRVGHDTLGGALSLAADLAEIGVAPLGVVLNGATTGSAGSAPHLRAGHRADLARDPDRQVPAAATP